MTYRAAGSLRTQPVITELELKLITITLYIHTMKVISKLRGENSISPFPHDTLTTSMARNYLLSPSHFVKQKVKASK